MLALHQKNGNTCYGSPVYEPPHTSNGLQLQSPVQKNAPHLVYAEKIVSFLYRKKGGETMLTFISLETEQYYCIDPCVLTVDDKGERLVNSAAHVNRDKYTGRIPVLRRTGPGYVLHMRPFL